MEKSGLLKDVNKKGILLISTLFFIVVLIMMSVALFALTRANYTDMRSFYSENEAITNAESAINIASFIIASNPVLLTINSSGGSNPTYSVNLGTLINNDNTNIIRRINANNYRIVIVNLRDGTIRSNDNTNINITINNRPSKDMAAMIISPRNKNILDSGAILFFGNSTSTTNTYNINSANAVAVSFINNIINFYFNSNADGYPTNLLNTYPLYTSVNNLNSRDHINNINNYRKANGFTLLLMAMGYSKVPNTNRYVVRYVDQKLANGGLLSATAYSNGTMNIDARANVFSVADQAKYNKLIAKNFSLTLTDSITNPSRKTLFKLANGQDSNRNGYLIAKQDSGNNFEFDGIRYESVTELLEDGRETQVEDSIKAEVLPPKDQNVDTSKIRDSLATLVQSKFNDPSTYVTLPAGYYIFVDSKKIVYFPPTMSITNVQDVLGNYNLNQLSEGINYYDGSRIINQNNNNSPFRGISGISVDKYQLIINKNIKIDTSNAGGNNIFFVSSFGKVNKNDAYKYFGNRNVQIVLGGNNQGAIVYGQDVAVTIDGAVKGKGTFATLSSNPSSSTTVPNSFAVDYTNSNADAFYPYRYDNNLGWVGYNGQSITTLQDFQAGSMVIRFDQVKSSEDNLALLVDNDLYINPIDFNTRNLDWFDHIFANTLKNWAPTKININNSSIDTNEEIAAFQYLFDHKKWDFNKIWKDGGRFNITRGYEANVSYTLSNFDLNVQSYYKYQGDGSSISFSTEGWQYDNPSRNFSMHILRIPVNINNTYYTIQLTETQDEQDSSKSDLKLEVYNGNIGTGAPTTSPIYTSNLFDVDRNAAMGLFDYLDGTSNDNTNNLTIGKLAWVMAAFTKSDPNIIKDVTNGVNNFNWSSLKDKSKDFAESRLEGLYRSYRDYLNKQGGNNNLIIKSNPTYDSNYFPFLYSRFVGSRFSSYEGAINNLAVNGSNSVLINSGYSEKDVKLQGMVFVGNQLKARTGSNNNLLFQGNIIVGNSNNNKDNSGNVTIKGVKNTTFYFDLDSIDPNILNGSFIRLEPVLYKQESVISK